MNESNPKDVYELKFKVSEAVLVTLNRLGEDSPYQRLYRAIGESDNLDDQRLGREGYIDLLDAALSGKRVVNPKTDRERIEEITNRYPVPFITADSPKIYSITDRELAFLFRLAHEHVVGDPE